MCQLSNPEGRRAYAMRGNEREDEPRPQLSATRPMASVLPNDPAQQRRPLESR